MMNFEALDLLFDLSRGQQGRDYDDRAQARRHPVAQIHPHHDLRSKEIRDVSVHERDAQIHRRNQRQDCEPDQRPSSDARLGYRQQRQRAWELLPRLR